MAINTHQCELAHVGILPDVRTISPDDVFYHGTRAPIFDRVFPCTCFTRDIALATSFAQSGSYQLLNEHGHPGRVISVQIHLPHGALFVPGSQVFHECISMLENTRITNAEDAVENARDIRELRRGYHEQASNLVRKTGLNAYFADMYEHSDEASLVVLYPDVVAITNQDIAVYSND